MDWFSMTARQGLARPGLRARQARRNRPSLEAMEGRQLLSSMVATFNGVAGIAGGAAWHYQQDGGWSNLGGIGVTSIVHSRDQYGGDEIFARLNDSSIWSYTLSSGQWRSTGGHADSLIAASNGVFALAGGSLFHYQDNGGWTSLGGVNVASIVDSHDQHGLEEVFVRLNDASVWSYTIANGQWNNTGGQVDTMVGAVDGINALAGGHLWHYQDDGAWSDVGGIAIESIVDTRNQYGQDVVYTRLGDASIWSYTFVTGQWKNTGGRLDNMIANANGISGTNSGNLGYLWHYQENGGWLNTGGIQVASVVDTYNQYGQEEMFARLNDHSIRAFSFATNSWYSAQGALD